jgi:hypothetical protein
MMLFAAPQAKRGQTYEPPCDDDAEDEPPAGLARPAGGV